MSARHVPTNLFSADSRILSICRTRSEADAAVALATRQPAASVSPSRPPDGQQQPYKALSWEDALLDGGEYGQTAAWSRDTPEDD
jgi:hypothetical protein